jgi:hypothetical protein
MNVLEQEHIDFLRKCAAEDKTTHEAPEGMPQDDLDQMVREGLLIEYSGVQKRYTITTGGARLAQSYGSSPELEKIAIEWAMSKGYDRETAERVVKENGAEVILRSKAEELNDGKGQREVTMRTEGGKPVFKAYKP